jgi:prepilin-type N-terminal cleavage/methylation domain-containing protein
MTSRTGNKRSGGFTLVEIMVATAVLSFGIISIYQALFITLDAFNYASGYLDVIDQVEEKVWEAQDTLARQGPEAQLETAGTLTVGSRSYGWELSYVSVDENELMYKVDLTAAWKAGKRKAQISRSAYALYENKDPLAE